MKLKMVICPFKINDENITIELSGKAKRILE